MYSEVIFQHAFERTQNVVQVNGMINNLRFADDTVIIADKPEGFQRLIDEILK